MDHRFLTEISEAFLISNGAYSRFSQKELEQLKESVVQEVLTYTTYLRESDIELYNMLYDRSKSFQQQIINDYLTYQFADEESINESIESIALTTGGVLGAIAAWSSNGALSKFTMNIVEKFGKLFENIGKSMVRRGRFWKFRYAIIQRNAKYCYTKCGLKPEDTNMLYYMNVSGGFPLSSIKLQKEVDCLKDCFVVYAIENIALQLNYYFVCIKKQGNFYQADKLTKDDIIKVISGVSLSAACVEYFKEVKNSFDQFYDLLDFIYGENDAKKQDTITTLRDKVIAVRNEISRTRDLKKYS